MADRPDPFDTLKQQGAGMVDPPLPAAEVRARGDRMRRRRTAFRAVAAAAAVAVVTTGGVAIGGQLSGSPAPAPATDVPSPQPSPTGSPSPSPRETDPSEPVAWVTEIPEGFPLAAGWPDATDAQDGETLTGPARGLDALVLDACGRTVPDPGSTDRLNAVWSNVVNMTSRELRVFADDQEAVTHLARLRNLWRECDPGEGDDDLLRRVRPTSPGDESFALLTGTQLDETTEVTLGIVQVVRIGNAVFADEITTEGGLADMGDDVTDLLAGMAEKSHPVIEAMCAFGAEPCGNAPGGGAEPEQPTGNDIPADFPLDLDHVDMTGDGGELLGPGRDVRGVETAPCGTSLWSDDARDRLAFVSTGPEYADVRELRTYADADDALAQMAAIRDTVQGCSPQPVDGGGEIVWRSYGVDTGYDQFAFGSTHTRSLGGEVVVVVRVGRSVLVLARGGEFAPQSLEQPIAEQATLARRIAADMCVFTRSGC